MLPLNGLGKFQAANRIAESIEMTLTMVTFYFGDMAEVYSSRRNSFSLIIDCYVTILATIAIFVAYLDLGNFLQISSHGVWLPKYVYFALAVMIAPLLLLRFDVLKKYIKGKYSIWTISMVALNFFHWIVLAGFDNLEAAALTMTRIQFLILGAMLGFVLVQCSPVFLGRVFIFVALILTGLQLFDFFSPGTLVPLDTAGLVSGRAGATLVNPNRASESLILLTVLGMGFLRPRWRFIFLVGVFPGIFLSFSRAGIMIWALVVVLAYWYRLLPRRLTMIYSVILIVVFVLVGSQLWGDLLSHIVSGGFDDIMSRIMFFSSFNLKDYSAQERFAVALHGISVFLDHPIFGNGAGYTYFWNFSDVSTHNEHILILTEYGLIGYTFFIWLMILMYKGGVYFKRMELDRLGLIAFFVFIAFTIFTHNIFDNLYWLTTIALLCQRRFFWGDRSLSKGANVHRS